MSKFTVIAMFVCTITSVASADTHITVPNGPTANLSKPRVMAGRYDAVYRAGRDAYSIPGAGTIATRGCTVSAGNSDGLSVRLTYGNPALGTKPTLWFYDRDGRLEADCRVVIGGR